METLHNAWTDVNAYLQSDHINALQGLLIAIAAAHFLNAWSRIFIVAAGAVILHAVLDVALPALTNDTAPHLPPLTEGAYWRHVLALYVGYLLIITVFYIVKHALTSGRQSA